MLFMPLRFLRWRRRRKGVNVFTSHRFATWNVLTLNGPGKTDLLNRELKKLNIAVAGLQEVRWTGSGETNLEGYKLLWSGHETMASAGVGIAIRRDLASCISSWRPISPRLIYARLHHSRGCFSVFSCYAPTNVSDQEDKDTFFGMLAEELGRIPQHDIVLVLGDFNATIGDCRNDYQGVLGPFCCGPTNDNGYRTLNLASANQLRAAFSWFKHKEIHRLTWYSNDGVTRKIIDHVLFSSRWHALSDCRVYRSAELGCTDHRLVVATVNVKLKRAQPKAELQRNTKVEIDRLKVPEYASQYAVTVANRFAALDTSHELTIDQTWKQFEDTITSSALETVGPKIKRKRVWISEQSLQLVENCRAARLNNQDDRYRTLRKERRRSLRRDRILWLNRIATKAEENFRKHDARSLYQHVRELCEQRKITTTPLLSPNGEVVTDSQQKLRLWSQHYAAQLNTDPPPSNQDLDSFAASGIPSADTRTEPPTRMEIMEAIKRLSGGKSPGPDGITSELMKAAAVPITSQLVTLCQRVWECETVPSCWANGTIIPVYKNKGDQRLPSNYRPITLLSVPGKVVMSILMRRILPLLLHHRRPEQAGFTPGRSTVDCILALRVLAEQRREFRKPLLAAYVDLKSAFDSINRDCLWTVSYTHLTLPTILLV